jgi:AraC-like DNA-binding protein
MPPTNEFIHFEQRACDHPLIEKVWRCHSEQGGNFLSIAANNFEIAITRLRGQTFLTLRGPETSATPVGCPAEGEWVGIRFKAGAFMPQFPPGMLRDHNDVTLSGASTRAFWLNGSAIEYPSFDDAEAFVERLSQSGALTRDPVIEDALRRQPCELSLRSAQRHFLEATGLTHTVFRQVERARYATSLLREGVPILDVVHQAGYFDQAHLTRSLRRFIGETPARIIGRRFQLSFLYKTDPLLTGIVLP